jgi:hypothetical protein
MRAVTEVVASARFHLVMDREKDKYYQSTIIGDTYSLSPPIAALETAKMAKPTKRTRSEIQKKASEKRFAHSVAKTAKRESRLLAEAAIEDAATQAVLDVGVEIAKAMNQGS